MIKVLLTLAIVVLALMWWFGKGRRGDAAASRRGKPGAAPAAQAMVSCAHCGLHLPRAEALLLGEQTFCCAAHRDAGARRR